ncbi:hypothetical protein B0H14DRAFT_3077683 [Mycena olivaceomarginata]|nr:hypothetical protein B0H14DRAFT_3077683 [Mycena olivaceomarginata]
MSRHPKDDSLRPIILSGDPKLSDFQNQKQLEGQVLSLCAGFFREIEALLKNTDPSVVARCCPVNVLQMLSDVKRRSDILLEEHLNLMHSLPHVVPTISRLNGERGSKRRRQTDEDVTGSSPFEAVSSRKPPKQSKGKRCCRSCGGFGHYLKTCSKTTSITRRITSNTKLQLIESENGLSAGSMTRSALQHSHPTPCDNVILGFDTSNDVAQPREQEVMEPAENTIDLDELKRQRALDGAQAAAMLEALSRICPVSCGWQGCAAECIEPSVSENDTTGPVQIQFFLRNVDGMDVGKSSPIGDDSWSTSTHTFSKQYIVAIKVRYFGSSGVHTSLSTCVQTVRRFSAHRESWWSTTGFEALYASERALAAAAPARAGSELPYVDFTRACCTDPGYSKGPPEDPERLGNFLNSTHCLDAHVTRSCVTSVDGRLKGQGSALRLQLPYCDNIVKYCSSKR